MADPTVQDILTKLRSDPTVSVPDAGKVLGGLTGTWLTSPPNAATLAFRPSWPAARWRVPSWAVLKRLGLDAVVAHPLAEPVDQSALERAFESGAPAGGGRQRSRCRTRSREGARRARDWSSRFIWRSRRSGVIAGFGSLVRVMEKSSCGRAYIMQYSEVRMSAVYSMRPRISDYSNRLLA